MTEWEQRLADNGYRITAARRAVIEILQHTENPLSPQAILAQAKHTHPPLGLVTVYRMVNLLVTLKLVRRVHFEDGCHGYLPASRGHYHAVVCQQCGRAVEFPGDDDLGTLIERVEIWTGYLVQDHLLQLYGLCPICRTATA